MSTPTLMQQLASLQDPNGEDVIISYRSRFATWQERTSSLIVADILNADRAEYADQGYTITELPDGFEVWGIMDGTQTVRELVFRATVHPR